MKTLLRLALLPFAALTLSAVAPAPASASLVTLPFNASYNGIANVVEVVDPGVPVLRFETNASGTATFGLTSYFSTDVIDMSTGAGTGTNRFIADNGDTLFGSFSVQVIPTSVPNIVDLIGEVSFTGGTGFFDGATGSALFSGTGVFDRSGTSAEASLTFDGSISTVPEPGSLLLVSAGMGALAMGGRRRSQRGSQAVQQVPNPLAPAACAGC